MQSSLGWTSKVVYCSLSGNSKAGTNKKNNIKLLYHTPNSPNRLIHGMYYILLIGNNFSSLKTIILRKKWYLKVKSPTFLTYIYWLLTIFGDAPSTNSCSFADESFSFVFVQFCEFHEICEIKKFTINKNYIILILQSIIERIIKNQSK